MSPSTMLDEEREFYRSQKEHLLRHYKGQFALIKGRELLGTFTTLEEAFKEGVRRLGNQPFLIQHITEKEEIVQYPALTVGMLHARL